MDTYEQVGAQLRSFMQGFMGAQPAATTMREAESGAARLETEARLRRRDTSRIPGSRHYATVLAYGNFIIANSDMNIRCEAIQGVSGVMTLPEVKSLKGGAPQVTLRRYLTHFFFENPSVVIEQNPHKESTGTLTGAASGDTHALQPGRASFSQYLILSLNGKPLANRDPLVMTAERVEEWPPIGAAFVSEAPTHFYELERVNDPSAEPFATLAACKAVTVSELSVPDR
ncbi:MAG: hypothetical protein JSR61_21245 [Proteobacteria bacterium]|nr:hypothetical protein [Pseudomonadota bacterium]